MIRVCLAIAILSGCQPPPAQDVTFQEVETLLMARCAFSRCHGGRGAGAAGLNFESALDRDATLHLALVGVPSCEYDRFALVEPHLPEESYLILKLSAPVDEDGRVLIDVDPDWVPQPGSCAALAEGGGYDFGVRMPVGGNLSDPELQLLIDWVAAGAPGP